MNLGQRIRHAIDLADMSVESVAKHQNLRVTPQAVYDWISGKTQNPRRKRLEILAEITKVNETWLVSGAGEPRPSSTANHGVRVSNSSKGRSVPKLTAEQAIKRRPPAMAEGEPTAIANFPCSEASYQLDITDDSNAPDYMTGDTIIVDPLEKPMPGDMVFATVEDGRTPVVRKYTLQIINGVRSVVLEALNADWGKHTENIEVIGVVMEHSEPRRRGPKRVV